MADELVRIKVLDQTSQPIAGALVRVHSSDAAYLLVAQGLTSAGPTPAEGIFETILPGAASPGQHYEVSVNHPFLRSNRARAQIGVLS
jgi:hypothetical protein